MGVRPPRRCQCDPGCKRPPLPNEPFCKFHKEQGCPRVAPLTGFEPGLSILKEYGENPSKRRTHNCYAFAVGYHDQEKIKKCESTPNCDARFHSPGNKAGMKGDVKKSCPVVVSRTLGDIPEARLATFEQKCPKGMSKISVVVDENQDFHYYVQTKNGYFVHKPGARMPTTVDSEGSKIYDPQLASRYYPAEYEGDHELNYRNACPFICVPRTHPNIIKGGSKHTKTRKQKRSLRAKRSGTRATLR